MAKINIQNNRARAIRESPLRDCASSFDCTGLRADEGIRPYESPVSKVRFTRNTNTARVRVRTYRDVFGSPVLRRSESPIW